MVKGGTKKKKFAPAPKIATKEKKEFVRKKDWKTEHGHLFPKRPKNFGIGRDILPKHRDLTRYVKWPKYIRVQRQYSILKKRLKVPPAINQFTHTLDKNHADSLFRMLLHYRPETHKDKYKRLLATSKEEAKQKEKKDKEDKKKKEDKKDEKKGKEKKKKEEKKEEKDDKSGKPVVLKFGINHITRLVEKKKAKLVVIAHDVDPIELVVWLPALCRKMEVPFCIVKSRARLGTFVHLKTAPALVLTEVKKEHQQQFDQIVAAVKSSFNDNVSDTKKWGGGIMGMKAQNRIKKQERAVQREKKSIKV